MLGHSYPAKSCGNPEVHPEHLWVTDKAYACFGVKPHVLTDAQKRILWGLDRACDLEVSGNLARSLKVLKGLGLVTFQRFIKPSPTYYYPNGTVVRYRVRLTKQGSDFIYNGGLDKPRPVV